LPTSCQLAGSRRGVVRNGFGSITLGDQDCQVNDVIEGEVNRVEGGFPPVGPLLAALACGIEAHDHLVKAFYRR
jgi:hypothetical protein